MAQVPGIETFYTGDFGEIRHSKFFSVNKSFADTASLSFKYVLRGKEIYTVDGEECELEEQQLLFFSDNKSYQARVDHPSMAQGLCIDLHRELRHMVQLDVLGDDELFIFHPEFKTQKVNSPDASLHNCLANLELANRSRDVIYMEEAMQDVIRQIVKMESEFVECVRAVPAKNRAYKKELFARLLAAKNFIHESKFDKLTLADIAREGKISAFYLHRLFKQVFGVTPARYHENIRMNEAKNLLKYFSVKEVALTLGFIDDAYFSKRFKLFFGVTPGGYANSIR